MKEKLLLPVAIVIAPSSVKVFNILITDEAYYKELENALLCCEVEAEGKKLLILGQVVGVRSRHKLLETDYDFLEKLSCASEKRVSKGRKEARFNVIGSFKLSGNRYEPVSLRTPPSPGTYLYEPDEILIKQISKSWQGRFYLGKIYGTSIPAPCILKHFGPFEEGGWGEAQFFGIFGGTGSGKSVMAANIMVGMARYSDMSILLIDPKGEFSGNKLGAGSSFEYDFHLLCTSAGKIPEVVKLYQVALSSAITFSRLLVSVTPFVSLCGIGKDEAIDDLERELADFLTQKISCNKRLISRLDYYRDLAITPKILKDDILPVIEKVISSRYVQKSSREEKLLRLKDIDIQQRLCECWEYVRKNWFSCETSSGRRRETIRDLLEKLLNDKLFVILDMSQVIEEEFMPSDEGIDISELDRIRRIERYKPLILRDVLLALQYQADKLYRLKRGRFLNCLVVMDEAHIYAPRDIRGDTEEEKRYVRELRLTVRDTVRMARKTGLGMMFISQTTTSIDGELFKNFHVRMYGWGMFHGADAQLIKEYEGEDAFYGYSAMPNPKQTQRYGFLVSGPIVGIGAATGSSMLIEGFGSDKELADYNGLDLEKAKEINAKNEQKQIKELVKGDLPGFSAQDLKNMFEKDESPSLKDIFNEDDMPI